MSTIHLYWLNLEEKTNMSENILNIGFVVDILKIFCKGVKSHGYDISILSLVNKKKINGQN